MPKIPVSVIALFLSENSDTVRIPASRAIAAKHRVIPLRILTSEGNKIMIDRVEDIRREASTKAGELGDKYVCVATFGDVQKEINLFKDEDSWYLEEDF